MNPYAPLLILFGFVGGLGLVILLLSHFLGAPPKMTLNKGLPYECGINSVGSPHRRFSVKFYLVSMLFIVFDVEIVFLYPWSVLFRDFVNQGQGLFMLIEMVVFIGVLSVGLVYVYGRKALDWKDDVWR